MNIQDNKEKDNAYNVMTHLSKNEGNIQNSSLAINITQIASLEGDTLLVKQDQSGNELNKIEKRKSTLKKVLEYTLGVTFFTGVVYLISKGLYSRYVTQHNSLTLKGDNNTYPLKAGYAASHNANVTERMVRKSRHFISQKNHPYRYYYNKNQPKKCSEIKVLKKCKKEHKRNKTRGYQSLILNVGYMPCFCPPPDNKKLNIILPPYNYTYTSDQPNFCQSKNITKSCYKHQRKIKKETNKYAAVLTFTVKKTKCYCPPLKGLIVNIISPETERRITKQNENKTAEIIEKKQKRVNLSSANKPPVEKSDQSVTIEKIYDYSCVDKSENIDFSKALEIIANTLKAPISMMAEETSIVYQHNILHQGCPSEYNLQKLREIASIADKFLNAFIQFLPYNQGLVVTQNIISPMLMAISQELNNNPINIDLIDEINTNVLFIFQDFLRSMTGNDIEDIKTMSDKTIQEKTEYNFNHKFKVNKEGLAIIYNNKKHQLNIDIENRPYIEEGNEIIFVGYDENDKKWNKLDNYYLHFYSLENIDHAKEYNTNNIHDDFMYNPENIKDSAEAEMFLSEHKFPTQHIFILNNIIPVYILNLSSFESEVLYITSVIEKPKRIIINTPFGFVFDRDSTDVSYSLGLYLENNINGKHLSEIDRYSKIHNDKFSYDRGKAPHIKYNNIYYPVYPHDPENGIYNIKSEMYNEIVFITLKDSILDFHESTVFNNLNFFKEPSSSPDEFKTKTVEPFSGSYKIIPIKSEHQDSFFIDFSAYNNLLMNGKAKDNKLLNIQKKDSLIYKDTLSKSHYLRINNIFYFMEENSNSDDFILIKNKRDNENNIKLYPHDDIIIQVKENIEKDEYTELNKCKNKRDLTEASCIPLYINSSLKIKLDNNINRGASININDDDVKPFYNHPGFFHRKNKDYYYYNGVFFEIKIISNDIKGKKLSEEIVEVYAKSIFKTKRKIACFIFDEKEGRVELKEPDVLLAEKTGRNRDDMDILLERGEYYRITNIFNINDAINEVNRSNKLTLISPEVSDITLTNTQIDILCRHSFYENKNIAFTIIPMDKVTENHGFYIWSAKIKIKNHLKYAVDVVEKVISELKKTSEDVDEYLKIILGTDNKIIINKFSEELLRSLYKTLSKLDSNIIHLVSTIREPLPNSPVVRLSDNIQKPLHYKRVDEIDVKKGTFAFTTKTKENKIYVCIDRFYFVDPTHPDTIINTPNELHLAETLIHEATHAGYHTDDLYYMPHDSNGLLNSIVKSKELFINKLSTQPGNHHSIYKLARKYIESVPIYDQHKIPLLTDKDKFIFFISKDVGMLANTYLHNADFLTKIIKDIYRVNMIDKEGIQYYEKFLNAMNTAIVPLAGFLELDDNLPSADLEDTHHSLAAPEENTFAASQTT